LFIFTESRNPARELIDALRQDEPGLEVATDAGKVKCRHLDLSFILELGTDTSPPNSENQSLLLQNGERSREFGICKTNCAGYSKGAFPYRRSEPRSLAHVAPMIQP